MFGFRKDDEEEASDVGEDLELQDPDLPALEDEGGDVPGDTPDADDEAAVDFEPVGDLAGEADLGDVEHITDEARADEAVEQLAGRLDSLRDDLVEVFREEVVALQAEFGEAVGSMHDLLQEAQEAQEHAVAELSRARQELHEREEGTRELQSEVSVLRQELEERKEHVGDLEVQLEDRDASVEELEANLARARSKLLNITDILGGLPMVDDEMEGEDDAGWTPGEALGKDPGEPEHGEAPEDVLAQVEPLDAPDPDEDR